MALKVVLSVVVLLAGLGDCFSFPKLTAPTPLVDAKEPVVNWIEQRLDHFDDSNYETWYQRYYVNEQFYTNGGPIFIMIYFDRAADPNWLRGGQMMELAVRFNAKTFLMEQRFYGQSRPTEDTSVENLQYFTTEQHLADLAFLVQSIKVSHPRSKVVVFGGFWGGTLAAWARLRYPDLIDAAVSSSAPMLTVYDFYEYYEEVTRVLGEASQPCVEDIREATTAVTTIMNGPDGAEEIAKLFTLCAPLDLDNKMDVMNFYVLYADVFAAVVESASNIQDVQDYCDLVTNPIHGATPLDRWIELGRTFFHPNDNCYEIRYGPFLDLYANASWSNPAAILGTRQYLYWRCSQFADYPSSSSPEQPFGDVFPVDVFVQICQDWYDGRFTEEFIQQGVSHSNEYGGLEPDVTNTVFVHGSLDPWRILGIVGNLSETVPAIVIEGSSHIADMKTSSASDSLALKEARNKIRDLVGSWL